MRGWKEPAEPWRACFELAWEAYRSRTIPVGSVVVAPDGAIVGRGRNRVFAPPDGGLAGTRLAHAEIGALASLTSERRYRDHTLYSTLEPCLLCLGAALHSTVGRIAYAAADPFGGACSGGIDMPHWRRGAPAIDGPLDGWLARLSTALQSAFWQNADLPRAPEIVEAFGPDARAAGERIRALAGAAGTIEEALPRLLDCL